MKKLLSLLLTLPLMAQNPVTRQGALNTRFYAHDTGGDDTYVVAAPAVGSCPAALADGLTVEFVADTTNTGTATLDFCSLGALEITAALAGTDLSNGDLVVGKPYLLRYYDAATDLFIVTLPGTGSGSAYNPIDMTTEIYNDWSIVSDYPAAMGTYNGASACNGTGGIAASGQDPAGVQLQSEASTNNYCQVFYNSKTGATTARFPDYVSSSNFRAFSFAMRLNPTSTSDVRIRFGAFASVTADPQGVYLEYDSSVGSTWYCVVNDGTATSTNTTVTATTSRATVSISATAAGTLSCSVDGSTPVTAVDTFPTSTFWGWQIKTLTNANKAFQANSPKLAFTGLTR
jgi:hypothetical protein